MKYRCAILDDYQNVALSYADWSSLAPEVDIKVFNQPFKSPEDVHRSLQGFQIICMMRERTAFLRNTLEALPDLKLLVTTGARNRRFPIPGIDLEGVLSLRTVDDCLRIRSEVAPGRRVVLGLT